ncbi:subtilisin-like protease SBT4.13 [Carica papaya]|uniref:subtilisin-like protease SBT4.13 n=1 Tax=Carica papaya TaxID=3649 RepID=UPI000B8CEC1D|nr:subtilisin-like protease SBT4.13 [Carica papaya]
MGSLPNRVYSPSSHHFTMLQDVIGASFEENLLVRSYGRSFNGFAANITDSEKQKLEAMEGVVSVFPRTIFHLQTTRSWGFLGFNDTRKLHDPRVEGNIVVGVIDSGIWPESKSFNDKGFGPAPKKWKGACNGGKNFTCNNKIIGARFYTTDSARDTDGHGSHTASTAAGNEVSDVSFFGMAKGVAIGGVPFARIAAYKVCVENGCGTEALLAAFDDAIADGVDVITISIAPAIGLDFVNDPIAIGAFHAMAKGIITVQSAGNSGPSSTLVASVAPWILSVAASTIDRSFVNKVVLGNGKTLVGKAVNTFSLNGVKYPLAYGKGVIASGCTDDLAERCLVGCLDSGLVKGKIVLCDEIGGYSVVQDAGGLGSLLKAKSSEASSNLFPVPVSALVDVDYDTVKEYIKTTDKPVAEILKSETIEDSNARIVAYFSSRGPNSIAPDILKPDLSAPGVDILAAFSPLAPLTKDKSDSRRVDYNVMSGTSMACPHVAAVAAYVKALHPDWSPSAIHSALMTTALPMKPSSTSDAEFAYGSGHINPLQSANPGLVYEASKEDYIKVLCGLGYNSSEIKKISGDDSTCPVGADTSLVRNLNYPSMATNITEPGKPFTVVFHRTVTNVGLANSVYKATISSNANIKITVEPNVLSFKSLNEKMSFDVTVVGNKLDSPVVSGSLVWSDSTHQVRSPIVMSACYTCNNVNGI